MKCVCSANHYMDKSLTSLKLKTVSQHRVTHMTNRSYHKQFCSKGCGTHFTIVTNEKSKKLNMSE
jgi:hypothetical protein